MAYDKKSLEKYPYFCNKDLAYTLDVLTKVINRENIIGYIRHLLSEKIPFSLCIVDIDNFKIVNDELGHQVGDIILQKVAEILVDTTAGRGIVGRYGGDEFILVSTECYTYDGTWNFIKSFQDPIREKKIQATKNSYITLTVGAASYDQSTDSYEELFLKADKALYRGKQKGRNCFIVYVEEKHKDIEISDKQEEINDTLDCIYNMMTKKDTIANRMKEVCYHLDNLLKLESYYIYPDLTIKPTDSFTRELPALPHNFLDKSLGQKNCLYINDFMFLEDVDLTFFSYCWATRIKSFALVKLTAYGENFGYILFANYSIKRIWQKTDMVLFSFFSKILSLMMYAEKKYHPEDRKRKI